MTHGRGEAPNESHRGLAIACLVTQDRVANGCASHTRQAAAWKLLPLPGHLFLPSAVIDQRPGKLRRAGETGSESRRLDSSGSIPEVGAFFRPARRMSVLCPAYDRLLAPATVDNWRERFKSAVGHVARDHGSPFGRGPGHSARPFPWSHLASGRDVWLTTVERHLFPSNGLKALDVGRNARPNRALPRVRARGLSRCRNAGNKPDARVQAEDVTAGRDPHLFLPAPGKRTGELGVDVGQAPGMVSGSSRCSLPMGGRLF